MSDITFKEKRFLHLVALKRRTGMSHAKAIDVVAKQNPKLVQEINKEERQKPSEKRKPNILDYEMAVDECMRKGMDIIKAIQHVKKTKPELAKVAVDASKDIKFDGDAPKVTNRFRAVSSVQKKESAKQQFDNLVEMERKNGNRRAVSTVVAKYPSVHAEMLREVNAK